MGPAKIPGFGCLPRWVALGKEFAMRARLSLVLSVALIALPSMSSAAEWSVVRVSGPSPFPIGDCRPVDQAWWGETPGAETDPSIAINPLDPDNIAAAWVQDDAYGIVAASSFDGGATWTRTVVPGLTRCAGGTEDHILHARLSFGGDGRLWLTGETLDGFFPDPRSGINHIPVVTSIDGGLTWWPPSTADDLPAFNGFDRIAAEPDVDDAAVLVWHGPEGAASSFLSRSTDGGASWVKHTLPINPEVQPFQSVRRARWWPGRVLQRQHRAGDRSTDRRRVLRSHGGGADEPVCDPLGRQRRNVVAAVAGGRERARRVDRHRRRPGWKRVCHHDAARRCRPRTHRSPFRRRRNNVGLARRHR